MQKKQAIELLGGSVKAAARKVGVTYQAIARWPEELTPAIRDRVQAALYRERLFLSDADDANEPVIQVSTPESRMCECEKFGACHD